MTLAIRVYAEVDILHSQHALASRVDDIWINIKEIRLRVYRWDSLVTST